MATLEELVDLAENNQGLKGKVIAASVIKAKLIFDEASPTATRLQFATDILDSPRSKATLLLDYVLGANEAATVAAIVGATDSAIQTNVDAAIDVLAT